METGVAKNQSTDLTISAKILFSREDVKAKFQELLGKRAPAFITSVLQIVANNTMLSRADPSSVYQSAAVAATLDLPLNNSLGFAYIVPYNQKQQDQSYKQVAQFQIGYKGLIQLAQRTGQFKRAGATPVYKGQLLKDDPLFGPEFDFEVLPEGKPIGYAASFELINGFQKTLYLSEAKATAHGKKFSQTFKKGYGLWNDDFDAMAVKTVIKMLLSKWAPLSIDMQRAIIADQAVVRDSDSLEVDYPDNEPEPIDHKTERLKGLLAQATTIDDVEIIASDFEAPTDDQKELIATRAKEIKTAETKALKEAKK